MFQYNWSRIIAFLCRLSSALTWIILDHSDLVADLLKELSNHNERVEERKGALIELLKIAREDSLAVWDEHFKTILLLLLETLGDKDVSQSTIKLACSIGTFFIILKSFICQVAFLCMYLFVVVINDSMHSVWLFSTLSERWLYGFWRRSWGTSQRVSRTMQNSPSWKH